MTSSGEESFALSIEDPNPLEHDNGAWQCFEAGSFRRLGARSVYVHHTVFDGAAKLAEADVPA